MAIKTRENKPDFKPYYMEHRKIMEQNGMDNELIVNLRREIHKYPEGGFQEFKTQKIIKETLLGFGVLDSEIKVCAVTGLIVDLRGNGPA